MTSNFVKCEEIVDWQRRDGLLYFQVKLAYFESRDIVRSNEAWLPIDQVPPLLLLNYICQTMETTDRPFVLSDDDATRQGEIGNKIKCLKSTDLANALGKFKNAGELVNAVISELFISEGGPSFAELKMRQGDLEKRLENLSSTSSSEYIRELLIDIIIERENLIVKYEPVKEAELCKLEAEINMICNEKKALRLSRNIRTCDVDSLKHLRYINIVAVPTALAEREPDIMNRRVPCSCTGEKCKLDKCDHYNKNGTPAYDMEGRLVTEYLENNRMVVYECNSDCRCGPTCPNRVVQNGSPVQKEVFSTLNGSGRIGLGVRVLESAKRGTFIGTYAGKLITYEESEHEAGNQYVFDVASSDPCYRSRPSFINAENSTRSNREDRGDFAIDALKYGNVTRLMNHCCTPNVAIVYVHIEISDPRVHDIAFFANRDIEKGEELCIHYGKQYFVKGQKCCCFSCKNERIKPTR